MKEDGERDPSGETAGGTAVLLPPPPQILPSAEPPPHVPAETPEEPAPAAPPAPATAVAPPPPRLPGRGADIAAFALSRLAGAMLTLAAAAGLAWLALPVSMLPDLAPLFGRLAVTLPLIGLALLLATLLGAALGWARLALGRVMASTAGLLQLLGNGLSPLLLALLLVLVVAGFWGWLPPGGFVPWQQDAGGALLSLALPAISLGVPLGLLVAQALTDAATPILARGEIVRGAELGLTRQGVLQRLVLPEALPDALGRLVVPLSLLPPLALVVEAVFYLPGLSRSILAPLAEHDADALFLGLVTLAALVILCRLGLDLVRGALDPRLTDRR